MMITFIFKKKNLIRTCCHESLDIFCIFNSKILYYVNDFLSFMNYSIFKSCIKAYLSHDDNCSITCNDDDY